MSTIVPPTPGLAGLDDGSTARTELYRLLAGSFDFPTLESFDAANTGRYWHALRGILDAAPFALHQRTMDSAEARLSTCAADFDTFCSEYIRLFEVGAERGKPPCPLYGGEYVGRQRIALMEELVRFYQYFGLALSDSDRELPDHISVEMEFIHYLAFKESHALRSGGDTLSFRRAQADFIERHPASWIPRMRAQLDAQSPDPFFAGLVAITADIVRADLEFLRSACGQI